MCKNNMTKYTIILMEEHIPFFNSNFFLQDLFFFVRINILQKSLLRLQLFNLLLLNLQLALEYLYNSKMYAQYLTQ